jgi:hypothetical protein
MSVPTVSPTSLKPTRSPTTKSSKPTGSPTRITVLVQEYTFSAGEIAGIVMGSFMFLCIVMWCIFRHRPVKTEDDPPSSLVHVSKRDGGFEVYNPRVGESHV